MGVVIAIDAGTTGVRAYAMGEDGSPKGYRYREFTQHFPRPGWVEHDPEEIWSAVRSTLADLVASLDEPVAAIGITDQRETVVAWSRSTGRPRHRAIVWQDRRTAARCEELAGAGHLDLVRRRTGLVLDPYFSASKIEWLLGPGGVGADPDLVVGTIDAWLLYQLTGGAVLATDPSNASRTMLYDIVEGRWSEELCDLFGVPLGALPEVRPSCGRFGTTVADSGVGAGVPVSGVAGDQQSSLFGQACFEVGMTKNTYGTGSFVLMNVGERCPEPAEGLLTTVAWELPGRVVGAAASIVRHYALEGAIFATGSTVQWLRDGLGVIDDASETEALARSVPDSGGVVIVPAFTGLGSPHWDPHARGAVMGLTRGSTVAHLARATVESMALQTRDVVVAMTAAARRPVTELRVDGGASAMSLLLELQADHLGVPVVRARGGETTAQGAAYLAGLAEGVWSNVAEVADAWVEEGRALPGATGEATDDAHARWQRAVGRVRDFAAGA